MSYGQETVKWRAVAISAAILAFIIPVTLQVDTSAVFRVPQGQEGGNCDNYRDLVNGIADEVKDMVTASLDAITAAQAPPPANPFKIRSLSDEWKNRARIAETIRSLFPVTFSDKKYTIKETSILEQLRGE